MYQVKFIKLTFRLVLQKSGVLPKYKTSAIRGGMGQMLLAQNCYGDQSNCKECPISEKCIVNQVMYAKFKKRPDFVTEESMGFVLDCLDESEYAEKGQKLSFDLTLFGDTIAYFTPILYAITALGNRGLGKEEILFEIESIENRAGKWILKDGNIYMEHVKLESLQNYIEERKKGKTLQGNIKFLSPVTLKYRGEFIQSFFPEVILEHVNRRIFMANCFEGLEQEISKVDMSEITEYKEKSYFVSRQRYSNTKQEKIILRGLLGEIQIKGLKEPLIEMLLAGEILHIGKNSRLGFGKYEVL